MPMKTYRHRDGAVVEAVQIDDWTFARALPNPDHVEGCRYDGTHRTVKLPIADGCVNWLIVGGESGRGARPFDVAWAADVVVTAVAAGARCFVKQLGSRPTDPAFAKNRSAREWPNGTRFETHARQGDAVWEMTGVVKLRDGMGGDTAEWPVTLNVREWPRRA